MMPSTYKRSECSVAWMVRDKQNKMIISLGHVKSVLLKAFGKHGARIFTERIWIQLVQKGSSKKRVEYCVDHKNSLCYFRAIQGHSGSIPIMPELLEYTSIPHNWKEYIFHRGCSRNFRQCACRVSFGFPPSAPPWWSHKPGRMQRYTESKVPCTNCC